MTTNCASLEFLLYLSLFSVHLQHYLYHSINDYSDTYVVEYAHISPTTLKAIVTDLGTESLYVQMEMYGFHPNALPVDYKPFLSNGQTSALPTVTSRPTTISSVRQLKILMNAQQSSDTQQQQQHQQQPTELGQQISSQDNSNINCMQQVLSSSNIGNYSLTTFAHSTIFNLFVTIFVAIMGKMIFM